MALTVIPRMMRSNFNRSLNNPFDKDQTGYFIYKALHRAASINDGTGFKDAALDMADFIVENSYSWANGHEITSLVEMVIIPYLAEAGRVDQLTFLLMEFDIQARNFKELMAGYRADQAMVTERRKAGSHEAWSYYISDAARDRIKSIKDDAERKVAMAEAIAEAKAKKALKASLNKALKVA